jgi:hypothetical protein
MAMLLKKISTSLLDIMYFQVDASVFDPSFAGLVLIRLTALGKLEVQKYHASIGAHDGVPCENSQHTSRANSSFSYPYVQEDNVVLRYSFMKLPFLLEHLKGNLSSALEKHDFFFVNKEKMDQIIISKEVSKYAKDNSSSLYRPISKYEKDNARKHMKMSYYQS